MLEEYMNQSASWVSVSTLNDYAESTNTPTTISCRKQPKQKLVTTASGMTQVSSMFIITKSPVNMGDNIDDRNVISSEGIYDLDGKLQWYEVYTQ